MVLKRNTSNIQKSLIAISTIFLVFGVFFGAYYFMSSKTSTKFADVIFEQKQKIDEANNKAANAINNLDKLKTSDNEEIKNIIKVVSSSEEIIVQTLEDLKKMSPPEKFKGQFNNYVEAVVLNRRIMYQTNLILKNPRSNDLQKAIDALDKYVKNTKKAYEAIKLEKSVIRLPDAIVLLPDNMRKYSAVIYNNYAIKANALEQYTQYFDLMDPLVFEFKAEMSDLNSYILLIKDGKATTDTLYAEIENKFVKLTSIKNNYIKISIPSKIAEQHKAFNDLLDRYTYYCQDFKSTLMMLEEAGTSEEALIEVNMVFDELIIRYKEIDKAFGNFTQNYESNKAFYKDINNL